MTTEDQLDKDDDTNLREVMGERRHLINLAYRLLGSASEAEDAVQETYARWYAQPLEQRGGIRSPGAWLTTVAGRICLDLLGTARARREHYVGEWIPEPLPQTADWVSIGDRDYGPTGDPADRITLDESVTMAFLVSLESMTPDERVALILHDVFGYTFPEVATIVGRTPAACRQLASSARRRARTSGRTTITRPAQTIRAFKSAWESRDLHALLRLLDPDATAVADSGGLAQAALAPIEGAAQVARHYLTLAERMPDDITITESIVNGQPGLAVQHQGSTVTVLAFDLADDRITHIWAVLNPDKLQLWTESALTPDVASGQNYSQPSAREESP